MKYHRGLRHGKHHPHKLVWLQLLNTCENLTLLMKFQNQTGNAAHRGVSQSISKQRREGEGGTS